MIGQSLAHYRVTTKIGAGGMGEVFRATDSRLNREVALKLLPEDVASDADRLARFHREAQILASLSHPNIGAIYGLEEAGGRHALVMELVEGEDLADRLRRGAPSLDEALRIARQIAEAVEAAHEKGIIHRDLKPANIKLTPDGQVKVLDFGLAKALDNPPGSSDGKVSQSPTLSVAATRAGIILGTAAYMSPEQAAGQVADKRSDVWSFGVVLYEMLAGGRLFSGETVSHTLADVLRTDIDWSRLPAGTPPPIRKLLERCLDRDRKHRLRDIGEARIVIDDYLAGRPASGAQPAAATAGVGAPAAVAPSWKRFLPWAVAGVSTALLAAAAVALWRQPSAPSTQPFQVDVKMATDPIWMSIGSGIEVSPDGSAIAYIVGSPDRRQLRFRRLDQLDATTLVDGTSDATSPYHPFFSPDGKWIGYATPTELRKVPTSGGTPLTLCKVQRSRGAAWLPDDTIVFSATPASGLSRVSASGGEPTPLTTLSKDDTTNRWPQALPGGKLVLFSSLGPTATNGFDGGTIEVLNLETGARTVVHRGGGYPRYVPGGRLAYVNNGTIFTVPFDLDRLAVQGSPVTAVRNVTWNSGQGAAQYSFSASGLLAYVRGGAQVPKFPAVWVDRNGTTSPLINEPGTYGNPRLSPDGRQLALTVLRDGNWDIWVYDLARGVSTRLTFKDSVDSEQIWSPDGREIVYSERGSGGADNLFRKRADGSGAEEQLTRTDVAMWANSWSSDGRYLIGTMGGGKFDIAMLPLGGDGKPQPFLKSDFNEVDAAFSPDGRWVAYVSDQSGRAEIYVVPFPTGSGRWQVSDSGGGYPRWSRNGKELFYRVQDGIMSASIETVGNSLQTGKPRRLFTGKFQGGIAGLELSGEAFADYDVSPDGQRFVMFPAAIDTEALEQEGIVTLVTSWFDQISGGSSVGR
jgi:serine/threonine-protein kinase